MGFCVVGGDEDSKLENGNLKCYGCGNHSSITNFNSLPQQGLDKHSTSLTFVLKAVGRNRTMNLF